MAAAGVGRRTPGRRPRIDEIPRFNKAQQDAFLPRVEAGDIVLIGATTENPSFEVNAALLSRSKVFVLQPLSAEGIETILRRALADPDRGLGAMQLSVTDAALAAIARFANGDARSALNLLEFSAAVAPLDETSATRRLDLPQLEQSIQRRALLYDKSGEEHYNLISALHKSMRNSDPDAAVYWVARMLEAGEDPLYIARRLCFASETSATPIRGARWPRGRQTRRISSACPKAIPRWRRPRSISPPRPRVTLSTRLMDQQPPTPTSRRPTRSRCTFVTRPRSS
jgi:putative ATPase